MCISDWRIGRLIRSTRREVTDTGGAVLLATSSQQRVGITFVVSGEIELVTDSLGPQNPTFGINCDGDPAISLNAFMPMWHATVVTHGDMPTRKFEIDFGGLPNAIDVIEYFLPESVITESLKSLQRDYPGLI